MVAIWGRESSLWLVASTNPTCTFARIWSPKTRLPRAALRPWPSSSTLPKWNILNLLCLVIPYLYQNRIHSQGSPPQTQSFTRTQSAFVKATIDEMDDGSDPPQEKEYIIPSRQEPYIDRKDLEGLLLKVFKKNITVFVSSHHYFNSKCFVAYSIPTQAPQGRV